MRNLWDKEPALFLGIIQSGLALAVSFGLHLTPEQIGGVVAFTSAIFAILTRSRVSPIK